MRPSSSCNQQLSGPALTECLCLYEQGKHDFSEPILRLRTQTRSTNLTDIVARQSIVYGIVQDNTENMAYTNVLKIGIGLKAWAFCLGTSVSPAFSFLPAQS